MATRTAAARGRAVFPAVLLVAACFASAPALRGAEVAKYGRTVPVRGHLIANVPAETWIERNYCGPACLAMVLNHAAGTAAFAQRAIGDEVFDASQQATYNSELVLYPRRHGYVSWSFQGDLDTLRALVARGIPVVVLTRPIRQIDKGHYRVVVGIDEGRGLVVFHDPFFGELRAMKTRAFLAAWEMGTGRNRSRWAMAVAREPGGFPFPELRDDPMTAINLATAWYRRSDFARSREWWEKARAVLPEDPYPLFSLAMVSLKEGRNEEAESLARAALRLDPASAYAQDVLGLALARRGEIPAAMETLGRALRLAPGEEFIRKHYLQVRGLYIASTRDRSASPKGDRS